MACADIWHSDRLGRVSWGVLLGGVGLSPHIMFVREESELVWRQLTCVAEGMGKDLMGAFHADELVSALFV